jgi:hypothetical protein
LIFAVAAIPLWVLTKRPLLAVILVSLIDIVGFWPTIRKSFYAPHKETLSTYSLSTLKHCLTVIAQQKYNLTTVLYPASLAIMTGGFVIMLIVRKNRSLVLQSSRYNHHPDPSIEGFLATAKSSVFSIVGHQV